MSKICLLYNYAQHYRTSIFRFLDKEFEIDFYFGDKMKDVKKMDYSLLWNFKKELINVILYDPIYYQKEAVSLFNKKYDKYIILGEYYCISTWILLLLCKVSRHKKVYLWSHGWYGNETFFKKIVKKCFFKLSNGIFLYGQYAKKLMIKEGFDDKKLHVVYNSLDFDSQIRIRNELKGSRIYSDYFQNDYPVLIFSGRLTKIKKLELLINASIQLRKRLININLVFVGTGSEEENLKKLMDLNNFKNYWFFGECYDEEKLGELIYNASICISPGNVGLTAIHSLVYGTPVITHAELSSQMPEFEAIEANISGDFFIKDNEADLIVKIEKWLCKTQNNRDEIRANCFKIIDQKYNPHFQMEVIKNVLNQ